MAVAPMLVSERMFCITSSVRTSPTSVSANAPNSWPSVIGTASWSCVRPILTIEPNSLLLARNAAISSFMAAMSWTLPSARPTCSDGGIGVVGGLRSVRVIVRAAVLVFALRVAHQFERAVGDDLVRVHVRRGAGAALEHVEAEFVVELAVHDLQAGAFHALEDLAAELAAVEVRASRGQLDHGERLDDVRIQPELHAGDVEVLEGAGGLDAVVSVGGNGFGCPAGHVRSRGWLDMVIS